MITAHSQTSTTWTRIAAAPRAFLTDQSLDVDALAEAVDGRVMSAFVRARKPGVEPDTCCA